MQTSYLLAAVFIFCFSSNLSASEICPDLNAIPPEDMRITESDLTEENALWAVSTLKDLIQENHKGLDEHETYQRRVNAQKMIKGYFLKLDAQKEKKGIGYHYGSVNDYCSFLDKGASWSHWIQQAQWKAPDTYQAPTDRG